MFYGYLIAMKKQQKSDAKLDLENVKSLLSEVTHIFGSEPNYIMLKSDKPLVFAGDTHGDIDATRYVCERHKDKRLVFLGDYIDRARKPNGSIENILYLFEKKLEKPDDIILLRGNHELRRICQHSGFFMELYNSFYSRADFIFEGFCAAFNQLPYVASTENGLLALHGGLPNIKCASELQNIPKGIDSDDDSKLVAQILWNDNTDLFSDSMPNWRRGYDGKDEFIVTYGKDYFAKKMRLLKKNVLVRGHDYEEKGYSFNNRLLTIFTSLSYSLDGRMKGAYYAILDDMQKDIRSTKRLRVEFIPENKI
jgi:serine/threonine-protein phosphatase 2B catalytic subunit